MFKNNQLISFEESIDLVYEAVDSTKDTISMVNRFTTKPLGIIITDTYNNPFFPIYPKPTIDTAKFDLPEVFRRYRELYSSFNVDFLPWHYCIEFVNDRYYVLNTRPLNMKFPIDNNKAVKNKNNNDKIIWNEITEQFFSINRFNIAEMIHIVIVGNSNVDIYTRKMYNLLSRTCIQPILLQYKLPEGLYNRVWPLNMGKKFNSNMLKYR